MGEKSNNNNNNNNNNSIIKEEEDVSSPNARRFGEPEDASWADEDYDDDDEAFDPEAADNNNNEAATPELAHEETKAVIWLRVALLLVLSCSAVGVSLGVLFYVRDSEHDDFEASFAATADKIFDVIGEELDALLGGLDSFGLTMLSYAESQNQTFPFATMPVFAKQASQFLAQSNAYIFTSSVLVTGAQRAQWEDFAEANNGWVDDVIAWTRQDPHLSEAVRLERGYANFTLGREIHEGISSRDGMPPIIPRPQLADNETYLVAWYTYPLRINYITAYNSDLFTRAQERSRSLPALETRQVVLGEFRFFQGQEHRPRFTLNMPLLDRGKRVDFSQVDDLSVIQPLGVLNLLLQFPDLYENILPDNAQGIRLVTSNTCKQVFTFELNGKEALFLNQSDVHDAAFEHLGITHELWKLTELVGTTKYRGPPINRDYCSISISVYPSYKTEDSFTSNEPAVLAVVAGLIFVFAGVLFLCYDMMVERRQTIVMTTAKKSEAIVSSLFPSQVRDRLFENDEAVEDKMPAPAKAVKALLQRGKSSGGGGANTSSSEREGTRPSRPVADLYPEASVMFADISGFTAWSSIRDPTKVFTLLETLYGSFDALAKKRGVFKVETIGDCYVAVVGLPNARKDHAVVLARFANECRDAMARATNRLIVHLGPDTADLEIRIGLHSGPVTAGVLRGDRARFQLFGDTVNTAARMESNGVPGRIQASEATAKALMAAGKDSWITKRAELVEAKGKGKMQTYWIDIQNVGSLAPSVRSSDGSTTEGSPTGQDDVDFITGKNDGLIAWNTETLCTLLRDIANARGAGSEAGAFDPVTWSTTDASSNEEASHSILDEYQDVIHFAPVDIRAGSAMLSEIVEVEVKDFVTSIASMYRDLPFHRFEHASHVTVTLSNIIQQLQFREDPTDGVEGELSCHIKIHNEIDRFAKDPLAVFACVIAVLIHCADHAGVSNQQLVLEKAAKAAVYKERSLNEQNAFNLAWSLLMDSKYTHLRHAIATTKAEWTRFRQIVVNCVLATDVSDERYNTERARRWEDCFGEQRSLEESTETAVDRKVTIAVEYMVQSAVVGHTMQHWHIFRKWYERIMSEAQQAFLSGRATSPPEEDMYQQELSFFDSFVIPLATKLDASGYFGGTGREHVEYAEKNRAEWEEKGKKLVSETVLRLSVQAVPEEVVLG